MKTSSFIMSLITLLWLLTSCEKEIHITNPKLFISPFPPFCTLDTVTNEIIADVEIDGEKVIADKYEWEVKDEKDNLIPILSQEDNKILWIPRNVGIYTVSCNIVSGNKSLKSVEKYQIECRGLPYIFGKWMVNAKIGQEKEWYAVYSFNKDFTINAQLDSVIKGNVLCPFGYPYEISTPVSFHLDYYNYADHNDDRFYLRIHRLISEGFTFNAPYDEFSTVGSLWHYNFRTPDLM